LDVDRNPSASDGTAPCDAAVYACTQLLSDLPGSPLVFAGFHRHDAELGVRGHCKMRESLGERMANGRRTKKLFIRLNKVIYIL